MRAFLAFALVPVGGCIINGESQAPPVELAAGAPKAIDFQETEIDGVLRGAVQHQVCVSASQPSGYVVPIGLIDVGNYGPVDGAPVQPSKFDDLDCPEGAGFARIEWNTTTGRGLITLAHSQTPSDAPTDQNTLGGDDSGDDSSFEPDAGWGVVAFASGSQTELVGTEFAGYDVTVGEPEFVSDFVESVKLHVEYRASGDIAAKPAGVVTVRMGWQPDISFYVVGGSPGVDMDSGTFQTDVHGDAYLLITSDIECSVLFATTPDGGTALAGSIACF